MTSEELRELLRDPDVPWVRELSDVPRAIKEGTPSPPTRNVRLKELVPFIERRTGSRVDPDEIDRLLVGELGAQRLDHVDLDDLRRRFLRRLVGRPNPRGEAYEVPESPTPPR